jgi:hypothetical protein
MMKQAAAAACFFWGVLIIKTCRLKKACVKKQRIIKLSIYSKCAVDKSKPYESTGRKTKGLKRLTLWQPAAERF